MNTFRDNGKIYSHRMDGGREARESIPLDINFNNVCNI